MSGIRFYIDDVAYGSEITVAPYSTTWDTSTTSDGTHKITAVVRDAANNTGSTYISVQVQNTVPYSCPVNLITNSCLENPDFVPSRPSGWSQGEYGINTTNFTYPIIGNHGN